ncbi:MAG: phosphotransferase enzyme family protein [Acidimicrobiales bacterium]
MDPSTADNTFQPLALPTPDLWERLGLTIGNEIHGGHQSRVFHADGPTGSVVVKLTDRRFAGIAHHRRIEVVAELAELNEAVVGPIPIEARLVGEAGDWLIVCYPLISGSTPDVENPDDVIATAQTLAALHVSLESIDARSLPPVATLRPGDSPGAAEQLIHGDFAPPNLIVTSGGVRVIDFDDCGTGTVEFDIGNSLYLELFDRWLADGLDGYRRYRDLFIGAYGDAATTAPDELAVEEATRLRVRALERWLDDPEGAPIGIRNATPAWRNRLRSFVASQNGV